MNSYVALSLYWPD